MEKTLFDTLIDSFGHIYVLTMSNRKERRELMMHQFNALNIPLPDTDSRIRWFYGTPFPYNSIIADAFNRSKKGRFTKPNEYDCSRNHYSMIKICYDLGYERVLIFEDDVLFLKDINIWNDYLKNIPEDFDIIQGSGFTADKRIQEYISNANSKKQYWFKHKNVGLWNTAFYALSRRGMEFYLTFMENVSFWVADGPIYKAPLSENLINTYASAIPLTIQADKNIISSDIRDGKNDTIDYNNQNEYEKNINLNDYFSPKF